MVDAQQISQDVRVAPRDRDALRALVGKRGYREVGAAVGRSKSAVGYLINGQTTTIPLGTAAQLEAALGHPPGALFRVAPDVAAHLTPYLR